MIPNNQKKIQKVHSFVPYPNAKNDYQKYLNSFCQSLSRLSLYSTKNEVFEEGNKMWNSVRSDQNLVNQYITKEKSIHLEK